MAYMDRKKQFNPVDTVASVQPVFFSELPHSTGTFGSPHNQVAAPLLAFTRSFGRIAARAAYQAAKPAITPLAVILLSSQNYEQIVAQLVRLRTLLDLGVFMEKTVTAMLFLF